jgi:mRNA-decapping enzyme subunit 2
LDFYREENSKLPLFSLKHFSLLFFQHCELLNHWVHDHELAYDKFIKYKTLVPVCGAIILNQNLSKILLVRGWKASAGWGFPKGKINKDESLVVCAIREVHEETGFDIAPYIRHNEYIEKTFNDQRQRLFIIAGIPENISFVTQTRKEIGVFLSHPGYPVAQLDRLG